MAELSRKELLKVMQNELACVHRQFGEMCDNGRDCSTCELCLPEEMIVSAYRQIISKLETEPTADVVEVKHGEWSPLGGDEWFCTNCGKVISTEGSWEKPTEKHCSECGAKMDGGKAE